MDIAKIKRVVEKYKKLYGKKTYKNYISGISPPFPLVTKLNNVYSLGTLVSESESAIETNNSLLWDSKTKVDDIIKARLSFVNASKIIKDKSNDEIVYANISVKEVEIETSLKSVYFKLNKEFYPLYGKIKYIKIISNPKIPRLVEKYIYDDIKSKIAIIELYKKGFNDYYLSKILSLGLFGRFYAKKLVPSRWAITAVHRALIDYLKSKIKNYSLFTKYFVFKYKLLGNIFIIVVYPGNLNFELLEVFKYGSIYNLTNISPILGRDEESGGYYATYLSFLEYLSKIKKVASATAIRIVTPEYYAPLGVQVVREGIKRALLSPPKVFDTKKEIVEFLVNELEKYNIFFKKLLRFSKYLSQSSLKL